MENTKIFGIIIIEFVIAMFLLMFLNGSIIVHEYGHVGACMVVGGTVESIGFGHPVSKVTCTGIEDNSLSTNIFLAGGIGLELIVAIALLAIPPVSLFGGIYLFLIGFFAYSGSYAHDFPDLFLFQFPFTIVLFVVGMGAVLLSLKITLEYWEENDEKRRHTQNII